MSYMEIADGPSHCSGMGFPRPNMFGPRKSTEGKQLCIVRQPVGDL